MNRVPAVKPFRQEFHQSLIDRKLPNLRNWSMTELVLLIIDQNPGIGDNTVAQLHSYMKAVSFDRDRPANHRRRKMWSISGLANVLKRCGCAIQEVEPFADYLDYHPEACPGWRTFSNAQSNFTNNIADLGEPGDPDDYAHISAVPYVDAATLDNRMRGYYDGAIARLQKQFPKSDLSENRV
jgi:hypothetical protein